MPKTWLALLLFAFTTFASFAAGRAPSAQPNAGEWGVDETLKWSASTTARPDA